MKAFWGGFLRGYKIGGTIGLVIATIALTVYLFAPAQAASEPEVTCVEWASAPPWVLTRCEDEYTGEVCISSTSGMLNCWQN